MVVFGLFSAISLSFWPNFEQLTRHPDWGTDLTKLLVSVRNALEASIAAEFPIDIIDVKDPDRGALGAADSTILRQIIARIHQRRTTSLALGELRDWSPAAPGYRSKYSRRGEDPCGDVELLTHFEFAKIGLADMRSVSDWQARWIEFARTLPSGVQPVGVAYLDHQVCNCPPPAEILELVAEQPKSVLLLDTFSKLSGNSIELWGAATLKKFLASARQRKVMTVVAGSLRRSQLATLFWIEPDFIGVRGAVCHGGRERLDRAKLARFCREFDAVLSSRSCDSPT